jgi:EmrB/QacA subfamily drug resistance transporter
MSSQGLSADPSLSANRSPTRSWLVLALICSCQFMVILDSAIINVALPSVQEELGFSSVSLAWVVNAYLLTFGGLMLLGGRAADLFGHRAVLVVGMAVFTLASLVAGLASSPQMLIAARAVQGGGAALLAPATLALINSNYSGQDRARAFGAWSAAGGLGGMAGAIAGGVLTTGLSWRWVFLINVPIGLLLITGAMVIHAASSARQKRAFDLAGAVTGTLGLAAIIYGVMQTAEHNWSSVYVAGSIAAGLALLAAFVITERFLVHDPMLPMRLFAVRNVVVGNAMLALFGSLGIAMWYFTSLLLQNVLHHSALQSGLEQTPAAILFVLVARFTSNLTHRYGVRAVLLGGCACLATGFGGLALFSPAQAYFPGVLVPSLIIATGIGLVFPTLMGISTSGVPAHDVGITAGLASTANQVGGAIGLAALTVLAAVTTVGSLGVPAHEAVAAGYTLVFTIASGLSVAIAALSLFLTSDQRPKRASI